MFGRSLGLRRESSAFLSMDSSEPEGRTWALLVAFEAAFLDSEEGVGR